jgi:hypothetical protein
LKITRKRIFIGTLYVTVLTVLGFVFFTLWEIGGKQKAFAFGRPFFGGQYFITNRELGWILKPLLEVRSPKGTILFKTDAFGFRNSENPLPPAGKVLLLGSAFIQGHYLSSAESVSGELESRIGGYVYNFGVGGYSVDQQFLVARAALKRFKVDAVVWAVSLGDFLNVGRSKAWGMAKPYFKSVENLSSARPEGVMTANDVAEPFSGRRSDRVGLEILDGAYLTQKGELYAINFRNNLDPWSPPAFAKKPGFQLLNAGRGRNPYSQPDVLAESISTSFLFFAELSRAARVLIVLIPEAAQVFTANETWYAPQRFFLEQCREKKLRCLEPHLEFQQAQKSGDLYFRDTGDLSVKGAAFTAEIIEKNLR